MNKLHKLFILFIIIQLPFVIKAQNDKDSLKWWKSIKIAGFIRNDAWYDSRQVVASREDIFLLFPDNISPDKNGKDINAKGEFNFSAIATRPNLSINGPDAFGAKTFGFIESDFTGISNTNVDELRLIQAYLKLKWKNADLLIGQYFHPLFTPDCFPQVIDLNTGAPFNPFNWSPQINLTRHFKNLSLQAVVLSQRDFTNNGTIGLSNTYIRNSAIPDAYLQVQYKGTHNIFCIGAEYKVLQPALKTDSNFVTNEKIGSYAFLAYWKYSYSKFSWLCKVIYGQNLSDQVMPGGYAIRSIDSAKGTVTYTPTNNLTVWGNILYGNKLKFGLFLGYEKNLGTTNSNIGTYYSLCPDDINIAYMYRIAPSVSLTSHNVQFSLELEYTVAAYGIPDNMDIVKNSKEVADLRVLFSTYLYF